MDGHRQRQSIEKVNRFRRPESAAASAAADPHPFKAKTRSDTVPFHRCNSTTNRPSTCCHVFIFPSAISCYFHQQPQRQQRQQPPAAAPPVGNAHPHCRANPVQRRAAILKNEILICLIFVLTRADDDTYRHSGVK